MTTDTEPTEATNDELTPLSTAPKPVPDARPRGFVPTARRLWRQLTSMRTALLLLTLLALAAIPGTFIPQTGLDPVKVDAFLKNHPHLGPFMNHLSLFDVFGAPWFAAIYLLLFVSLIGCLFPRIRLHAAALGRRAPDAPRHLMRLPASTKWDSEATPADVAAKARATLRRSRWRVDIRDEADGVVTVAAEKGYLRETGNLVFHVSLVVLLVGIAATGLYGFKGTVLVTDGGSFANAREFYDVFEPSRLFSDSQLAPFSFSLDKFTAAYQANGEPSTFNAHINYKTSPSAVSKPYDIEVNHPLDIDGAKVFLVGHGYSLKISVTNAAGHTVYAGDTPFLPDDSEFTSHGVVKIPDLGDGQQLGLTGFFYPTQGYAANGTVTSVYPGLERPVLSLAAWSGNLGMNTGAPQSVYSLNVAALKNIGVTQLSPGKSWHLKNGSTVTFHGVDQWATFQVAHEPGKRTLLAGAILVIAGLLCSLRVRRRRFWLRAIPATDGDPDGRTVVMAAGLARSDVDGFSGELEDLVGRIAGEPPGTTVTEKD
ncbi:MAG TPA: cytochrome c biogenesis protein ResB [Mycobacteriales bacterium]|jgi:cytochrome c biogenesis protein|nr:cytochrome c biogenesis protein ResB [Mycobacteriales bacterium]